MVRNQSMFNWHGSNPESYPSNVSHSILLLMLQLLYCHSPGGKTFLRSWHVILKVMIVTHRKDIKSLSGIVRWQQLLKAKTAPFKPQLNVSRKLRTEWGKVSEYVLNLRHRRTVRRGLSLWQWSGEFLRPLRTSIPQAYPPELELCSIWRVSRC